MKNCSEIAWYTYIPISWSLIMLDSSGTYLPYLLFCLTGNNSVYFEISHKINTTTHHKVHSTTQTCNKSYLFKEN